MKSCSGCILTFFFFKNSRISNSIKLIFKCLPLLYFFLMPFSAGAQEILNRMQNAVLIDISEASGLEIGERVPVIRIASDGSIRRIGMVEIARYQGGRCAGRVISEEPGQTVSAGDRIQLYEDDPPAEAAEPAPVLDEAVQYSREILRRVNNLVLADFDETSGLRAGDQAQVVRENQWGEITQIGLIEIGRYQDGRCAARIINEFSGQAIMEGDKVRLPDKTRQEYALDAPHEPSPGFPRPAAVPQTRPPSRASVSFLQRLEERIGINVIYQQITHASGGQEVFTSLDVPLEFVYTPSRYMTFRVKLNQGYQSFADSGFSGLSDLNISGRFLLGRNTTFLAGLVIPTGRKELGEKDIIPVSAARIPFINAPILTGNTGFGFNAGFAQGFEISASANFAVAVSYRYRTEYMPFKAATGEDGVLYKPSDELTVAAGINSGDKQSGFTADVQYSYYFGEKVDGEEVTKPGSGFAASFEGFLRSIRLHGLFYQRQPSKYKDLLLGEFKPPLLISAKLGFKGLLGTGTLVPFVGYEHTGEGTLTGAANLMLAGIYFEDLKIKGYPLSPFIQYSFGKVGGIVDTRGFRAGTNIALQIY